MSFKNLIKIIGLFFIITSYTISLGYFVTTYPILIYIFISLIFLIGLYQSCKYLMTKIDNHFQQLNRPLNINLKLIIYLISFATYITITFLLVANLYQTFILN